MINFNLFATPDEVGFTRLMQLPHFNKFVSIFKRMEVTVPNDPNKALYKDYTRKCYSTSYGEQDFTELPQADMFLRRCAKSLPTGWIVLSTPKDSKTFKFGDRTRLNTIGYVLSYEYVNMHRANLQGIRINYINTVGHEVHENINVDDLQYVAVRRLTDEEISAIDIYRGIVKSGPKPIYRMMMCKQEYKDDYNLYLRDCKEYGFKPLEKALINNVSLNPFNGSYTTFTEDGKLGWGENDDTEIVNK